MVVGFSVGCEGDDVEVVARLVGWMSGSTVREGMVGGGEGRVLVCVG